MEKCLHGVEQLLYDECYYCSGKWEETVMEIAGILNIDPQEMLNMENTVNDGAIREYEHVVPSEWMYLLIRLDKVEVEDLEEIASIALATGRSFLHTLWLFLNVYPEKFPLECTEFTSVKM